MTLNLRSSAASFSALSSYKASRQGLLLETLPCEHLLVTYRSHTMHLQHRFRVNTANEYRPLLQFLIMLPTPAILKTPVVSAYLQKCEMVGFEHRWYAYFHRTPPRSITFLSPPVSYNLTDTVSCAIFRNIPPIKIQPQQSQKSAVGSLLYAHIFSSTL